MFNSHGSDGRTLAARLILLALIVTPIALTASGSARAQNEPYSGNTPAGTLTSIPATSPPSNPPSSGPGSLPPTPSVLNRPPSRPGLLPFTGADLALLALTGASITITGALILMKARSRARRSDPT
ncbi:MAG TPA: hypothetical protein VE174_09560 [Actinomycetota bacterium]|nr:hypothetical protein [Actinomycetota bacterium]